MASTTETSVPTVALPPGPRLPFPVQTVLFGGWRHRLLPRWRRRYGDVFMIRIAPRNRRMVMLARPEHIREVFGGSATTYHAGEGNAVLGPLMGPHSLLLIDEDDHARVRRQLMPAFNGAALRGYRALVTDITREHLADWPVGREVASHRLTQRLTLDVICRVVFGVADQRRLQRLLPVVDEVVSISPVVMLGGFYEELRRYGPWRRHLEAQSRLDEVLYAEIAGRRRDPGLTERTDVLSRLLAAADADLSDEALRDQLVTLLMAGHETTATSLAWTLHELARSPAVLREAQRAADDGDDEHLEAVAKEALRLHPVIYEVARKLTVPVTLAGYRLPAGVTVMPAIGLVQADPQHFAEPEAFRPQRFLGTQPAPNTWIPFGGGARRCIGAGFSLMESVVVLGEILRRFDLHAPARPEATAPRNVTLTPARRARVTFSPR